MTAPAQNPASLGVAIKASQITVGTIRSIQDLR
jgi:hypothetical protein